MDDGINIEQQINNLPEKVTLEQNFPNPFNAATTIRYTLPDQAYIKLNVYDLMEREITEFENGYKQQAYHQVVINIADALIGEYIYKLSVQQRITLS